LGVSTVSLRAQPAFRRKEEKSEAEENVPLVRQIASIFPCVRRGVKKEGWHFFVRDKEVPKKARRAKAPPLAATPPVARHLPKLSYFPTRLNLPLTV
jgi:hypothetical protein